MVYNGVLGGSLSSSQLQGANMTLTEEESLWAVVDYNTMSSTATEEETPNHHQELASRWLDSWTDLFGVSNDNDQLAALAANPS